MFYFVVLKQKDMFLKTFVLKDAHISAETYTYIVTIGQGCCIKVIGR